MKNVFCIALITTAMVFIHCNNSDQKKQESKYPQKAALFVDAIISAYIEIKDALINDNSIEAAKKAAALSFAIRTVDESTFTADQKKEYKNIKASIILHSEHIEANNSDILHQREDFDALSRVIIDLVKLTGATKTLYKNFCAKYNDGSGAFWLSETKDISNPYYGKETVDCIEVKDVIKPIN